MRLTASVLLCLLISACGGGDSNAPASGPEATSFRANAMTIVGTESHGGHCATGGSKIDSGIDSNGDGRLSAVEVTGTQYTCHGAPGTAGSNGLNTLMLTYPESPGAHCAHGGNRIDAGLDRNGNGALGNDEISSTQYVCGGAPGVSGTPGSHGINALVQMSEEPAGAHCAAGGKKIAAGLDGNGNAQLELGEILSTAHVCSGVNGTNGIAGPAGSPGLNILLSIVGEAAGANCAHGGSRISSGPDGNANGLLDISEISAVGHVCHGAPGSNGGGFGWVSVSGHAVQAQTNTGYIASNPNTPVAVTLPQNPAIGDLVRVSGAGQGGWSLVQNAGQLISTRNLGAPAGLSWTARDALRAWRALASSSDGSRLVAVVNSGQIHTSTDSGGNWTARETNRNWYAVASSADGSKLAAVVYGGQIYTSADSGVSWTARETNRNWYAIAASADGSRLVAVVNGGQIYTSVDSGVSWAARDSARNWQSVASSADGVKLVAAVSGGQIYTSVNSGVNWTARASAQAWYALSSSADGNRLTAVVNGGQIHTSIDSGVSWTARESARSWQSVASSADGLKLVAAAYGGLIYSSNDGGLSWTARGSARSWSALASSADGNKLAAAVHGGQLHTSVPTTSLGTAGAVSGGQYDAIELQYLGSGMFTVLSHEGRLEAY